MIWLKYYVYVYREGNIVWLVVIDFLCCGIGDSHIVPFRLQTYVL